MPTNKEICPLTPTGSAARQNLKKPNVHVILIEISKFHSF